MFRIKDNYIYYIDDELEMENEIPFGPLQYTTVEDGDEDEDLGDIYIITYTYNFSLGDTVIGSKDYLVGYNEITDPDTGEITLEEVYETIEWYDGKYVLSGRITDYKYNTAEEIEAYKLACIEEVKAKYETKLNVNYITSTIHDLNGLVYAATLEKLEAIGRSILYGEHYAAINSISNIDNVLLPFNADNIITLSDGSYYLTEAETDYTYTKLQLQNLYIEIFGQIDQLKKDYVDITNAIAGTTILDYIYDLKNYDLGSGNEKPDIGDYQAG